jgi:methionine--tRNA ligase beta chain
MGDRVIPFGKEVVIERSDFFDLDGPEGKANGDRPPKGYKRLLPGGNVRLRYAYVIQCDEIVRDPGTDEPIELKCTYLPETRAGNTPEGMSRVKGIVHWVEASTGVQCKVNQYDRLFKTDEPGKESGDYLDDMNPDSLEVLKNVMVEPSVAEDAAEVLKSDAIPSSLAYQFERSGYFALDKDSTGKDNLVFNRAVTLRDTWGAQAGGNQNQGNARNRGQTNNNAPKGGGGGGGGGGAPVEDVRRVAFQAATILEAEPHPDADALLVCKVDCGEADEDGTSTPRTVVAGLAGKIAVENLVGRKIVAVTNLKPSKMRGIESSAMLLAASAAGENDEEIVELLDVPEDVPNGELLSIEGKETSQPDPMMKSKGALKAFDRVKGALRANDEGEATWIDGDVAFRLMSSAGPVKTSSLKDTIIQ